MRDAISKPCIAVTVSHLIDIDHHQVCTPWSSQCNTGRWGHSMQDGRLEVWAIGIGKVGLHVGPKSVLNSRKIGDLTGGGVSAMISSTLQI